MAGTQVLLRDQADLGGKFAVQIGGAGTAVTNSGDIAAAAAELRAENGNIYALAGNTKGVIRATEVSGQGGQIQLTSAGGSVDVAAGAVLDASASQAAGGRGSGGQIYVDSAATTFAGAALARGGLAGGDGGLIETSGTTVNFDGATINAGSAHGAAGSWRIDPTDLNIDATAAGVIDTALGAGTSVTLETYASGAPTGPSGATGNTNTSGGGDINIYSALSWSTNAALTLDSYHSINVYAPITVSGAGGVTLITNDTTANQANNTSGTGTLSFGLTSTGFAGSIDYAGAGGSLTINSQSYNLITTLSGLHSISSSGYYALATSLTASTTYSAALVSSFNGTFEGLGNTISDLTISGSSSHVGLFGTSSGLIRDIGVVGGTVSGNNYVGDLIGQQNGGSVTEAYATGAVSGNVNFIGGLVGQMNGGSITDAYATGTVSGGDYSQHIGGLVGQQGGGSITYAYATGAVSGLYDSYYVGGLVGDQANSGITDSYVYSTGTVTGTEWVGGLFGLQVNTLTEAYATGAVSGGSYTGGLAGQSVYATVTKSYWDPNTTGQSTSATGSSLAGSTLQGTLPSGFSSTTWVAVTSGYPTLAAFTINPMVTTAPAIAGTVFSDYGITALSGATVDEVLLSGGSVIASGTSASGTGAYSVAAPSSNGTVLLFLAGGGSLANTIVNYAGTSLTGVNLYGGYLTFANTSATTLSGALSGLSSFVSPGSAYTGDFLFSGITPTASVAVTTAGAFTVDQALTLTGSNGLQVFSSGGNVTVASPISLASGNLNIGGGAALAIDAPITVTGAGSVILQYDTSSASNLSFGLTSTGFSGSLDYTGTGGSFAIGRAAYTLLYAMSDLQNIDTTGDGGDYALARPLTATGTFNGALIGAGSNTFSGTFEGLGNTITGLTISSSAIKTGLFGTVTGTIRDIGLNGGSVIGGEYVGELVAYQASGSIMDAYATGTVSGSSLVGGLVGFQDGGAITNAYATGAVNGSEYVGGLVGYEDADITSAYATGAVNGVISDVGGLVGYLQSGAITDAYATGAVNGSAAYIGGLVGYQRGGAIADVYATGAVSANSGPNVGGLVAHQIGGSINDGYYDTQTTGLNSSTGNSLGTGLTTASFQSGGATLDGNWGGGSGGVYPYLTTFFPNGVQAISGIAYKDAGMTADASGVNGAVPVALTLGGVSEGSVTTGANGYYYFALPAGSSGAVLASTTGNQTTGAITASATATATANSNVTGLAIEQLNTIAGAVYSDYGATALGGATVDAVLLSGGAVFGTGTSANGTGAYSLAAPGSNGTVLLFLASGGTLANTVVQYSGSSLTGVNLYGGYLTFVSPATSAVSSALSTLASFSAPSGDSGYLLFNTTTGAPTAGFAVTGLTSAFTFDTALNLGANNLIVSDSAGVTQSAAITAGGVLLTGGGAYTLTNNANSIATLAANAGAVNVTSGALTVGTVEGVSGVTSSGAVTLTGSSLTLASAVTAGSGANTVLSSTGAFTNNVGSTAVSTSNGGVWDIYSATPAGDTFGSLNSNNTAVWDTAAGATVTASGNRYVFAYQPTLTVTTTSDSKIYGRTTTTNGIATDYTISGLQAGVTGAYLSDSASGVYSGTPTVASSGAAANANVGGGPGAGGAYGITANGLTVNDGYAVSYVNSGLLTVNAATLTAALTSTVGKTYDGGTGATLTSGDYTLTGFVAGQGATVTQTSGTYASANVGTGIAVSTTLASGNFAANSGTLLSNYVLPTTASGAVGEIDAKTLTAALTSTVGKTYDGGTGATLTSGDYTLTGFVAGQGATVTQTSGTYASANVGTGIAVSTTLASGNFAANSGTLLSNYVLPTTASGAVGEIDAKTLTAALTSTVGKTYDGGTGATLTSGDYTLTGFVAGQGATVTQTSGTYASANVGTGIAVSTTLASGNFAANSGTLLSNYVLPTTASGAVGEIDAKTLTAALTSTVGKTYDGGTGATLTSGDYTLTGFVAGQGATVTQTSGTYASANVGTGIAVSTTLASGNFAANSGTLLSNYVLPTTASGAVGEIDAKTLTAALTSTVGKTYDGGTGATLTSGDYTLTGFVAGQGATVTQTSGTYVSANVGTDIAVSTTLASGNFAANSGTLLSNYVLPTTASGAVGEIDAKTLTAALTSTVGKTYDGGTGATLTSGDYTLTGFVAGQGATVTQTSGTYASANVGTGIAVSTTLASGNFAANSGTLLSNYVLPTTASGAVGEIYPRAITITANNDTIAVGQPNLPLTYSLTNGWLVGGDTISGDLTRISGETPGIYPILQGTIAVPANYKLTFVDGVYTITQPAPPPATVEPANGAGSNASNTIAVAFSTPTDNSTVAQASGQTQTPAGAPAPSSGASGGGGLTPSLSPGDGQNTSAPYPDNQWVSSSIHFKVGSR